MEKLTAYAAAELTVKKSRFFSELFPCADQAAARAIIKEQKARYSDAAHVVHAFVLGANAEIMGMSDDGEPSGTAGRPALDVLKGRQCTDLVLTVTRWFGGILLGTGGLVKAYGESAKRVIAAAESAGAFAPIIAEKIFTFTCDYAHYEAVRRQMERFAVRGLTENFGALVTVRGSIPADKSAAFARQLTDCSKGAIALGWQ